MYQWISESLAWMTQRIKKPISMSRWNNESIVQWSSETIKWWFSESVNYESMIQWTMKQWFMKSMIEWKSEPIWINEWINEAVNQSTNEQWISAPMNEWTSDSMNQWTNETVMVWMNELISESMSQWINEWTSEWMDGRVSYASLLSYFFSERPLRWGTSCLSYTSYLNSSLLSELLLLWPCSDLPPSWLFCSFCCFHDLQCL